MWHNNLVFIQQEDIKLAILEPADPSDVTELVGLGTVDFGVKAMIHTIAAVRKDILLPPSAHYLMSHQLV